MKAKYRFLMGAVVALPTMATAADINKTANFTGDAETFVGGGGNWGDNVLRLGNGASGITIEINSGTLQDTASNNRHLNLEGTNNVFTFTGSSTQLIVNANKNWSTGSTKFQGSGNTTNILAGATFTAKGWNGFDGSSNIINIDGAGSKADFSADNNDGFGSSPGSDFYTTNRINITNGGTMYVSGNGFDNVTANSVGQYTVTVDGAGGRSVLGFSRTQYNGASGGGIAHVFNGGALETHGDSPNQFNGRTSPGQFHKYLIDGGVISYKGATAARMDESTAGEASYFTYTGNNAMRLNGSASTDTGSYTLANNLGTKNYVRLEMINGTTSVARAITIDGDNGGSMLFDGTTATIANGVTLAGAAATLTATGTDSSVTGVVAGSALVKDGAAKLTLNTEPTYSGDTTISEGTLALTVANSGNDASTVSIASGAFLELGIGVADTVDKLYLDGAQVASGTWGSSTSGAAHPDDTHFAGAGVLNVTSGTVSMTPYQTWSGGAVFTADANGDGYSNGLAWILGAASTTANVCRLLPAPGKEASYLTLQFQRVHTLGSAKLYLQYSNDLNNLDPWHTIDLVAGPLGDVVMDVDPGVGLDDVTLKIPTSHASASGTLLGRLHATEN